MTTPTLYVFSGLPGVGKTTLSQALATRYGLMHLRIDVIEPCLKDLFRRAIRDEGYVLANRLAADNLQRGVDVVADAVNPIQIARDEWEQTARAASARCVHIEVVCSDVAEHRRRVETRRTTIPGLVLPTWADVRNREYDTWHRERIVLDTAHRSVDSCLDFLLGQLVA